jgi:hypothetical protein
MTGTGGTIRTTFEIDREVWRCVRSSAVADGMNISGTLEEVLENYDMT